MRENLKKLNCIQISYNKQRENYILYIVLWSCKHTYKHTAKCSKTYIPKVPRLRVNQVLLECTLNLK